jgi:hypothetical protein
MAVDAGREWTAWGALAPKRFALCRREDATGVSGTGVVATGVVWPDGHAALRWKAEDHEAASSTSVWSCVADLLRVHGHGGLSRIVYLDVDGAVPAAPERIREVRRSVEPWAWPPG